MKRKIAPSILAADFFCLEEAFKMMEEAGADYVHFDVMDGVFVPNISFGIPVLESLSKATSLPFDVHLMIVRPENHIEAFAKAGADMITIHEEATPHLHRALQMIKELGKKAGVVLNPATPLSAITHVLDMVDMVLLMSVNPGYGGQKLIPEVLDKGKELARLREKKGLTFDIEIDGGVSPENADEIAGYGFDVLVAGSAVFNASDPVAAMKKIKGI
ncbi:MAG: ribulose-phosphate 3-epimerase [Eubacteriales bacterium]